MDDERTPEEIDRLARQTAHRLLNTPKKPKAPKPAEKPKEAATPDDGE